MRSVLFIGSDREVIDTAISHLRHSGIGTHVVSTPSEALLIYSEEGPDLVVAMLPIPDTTGLGLLRQLLGQDPRAHVMVTGKDIHLRGAPEALEAGALEYVSNPRGDVQAFLSAIDVSLGARKVDAQLRYLRRKDAATADWRAIVGQCPAMRQVFATIRQVCQRTSTHNAPTILITGETGTGKGLIAKTIHYNSARRSRSFVDINCAAIPASLIEAELFGHVRGAFTDARASRPGLLETADGGTLFLDEIGALQLDLQAKLLTVIEEKVVRRLGASDGVHVDVQIITATHRDLAAMAAHGELREDLYHRLNVIRIELPPLRDRGADRVLLAESIMEETCREYGVPARRLSDDARRGIESYDWPGNVRELRNQIERIVLLKDGAVVTAEDFQLPSQSRASVAFDGPARVSVALPDGECSLDGALGTVERQLIERALTRHDNNVTHTARYLGLTRQALIYRMRKHGLQRAGDSGSG
ncbi:sigma 54-interacting transcriptional regulator [Myxococcota bacterium]